MKHEIFKIQVPLHSSEENPPLLVYNRNRSIYFQLDMTEELERLTTGKDRCMLSDTLMETKYSR